MRAARAALLLSLAGCAQLPLSLPAPTGGGPAPPAPAAGGPSASAAPGAFQELEQQAHLLVNRHRAGRGLPALAYDARIAQLAREHSEAMAAGRRPFSHDGFEGRAGQIQGWMAIGGASENVAYNSRDRAVVAADVVRGWVGSSGHRQNIEGGFDATGIGVARARDGTFYFTQIFVDRR